MKSRTIYSTTNIMVHPAVWRHLDNNAPKLRDAYDLRESPLYPLISVGLARSTTPTPSHAPKHPERLRKIKVVITGWDADHYGDTIPPKHQNTINRFVYAQLLHEACLEILLTHIIGEMPRDAAIKEHLFNNFYEPEELNYAALRKHYQRHWMEREKKFLEDIEFSDHSSQKQPKAITKKNVTKVPKIKKQFPLCKI